VVSNLVCNKAEFNNIIRDMVRALVFNVTFNNILVISSLVCQGMLIVKLLKQGVNELRGSAREM
jgi:hypothetical protein